MNVKFKDVLHALSNHIMSDHSLCYSMRHK